MNYPDWNDEATKGRLDDYLVSVYEIEQIADNAISIESDNTKKQTAVVLGYRSW